MDYSCCFSLGGNLDFLDFLPKSFITLTTGLSFFKKTWPIPASFVYFHSFLVTISIILIEKSIDGVLRIQTRGHRMVGADKTTEIWRPPVIYVSLCTMILLLSIPLYVLASFSLPLFLCLFVATKFYTKKGFKYWLNKQFHLRPGCVLVWTKRAETNLFGRVQTQPRQPQKSLKQRSTSRKEDKNEKMLSG